MKETIRTMSALLMMMVTMAVFACTFTACSDDEDIENEVTYTYGFSNISASHPDFLEEMGKIENAFKLALGITGKPFTWKGSVEECDKEVREACRKAFNALKDETWQGDYTFHVTNVETGKMVCKATFSADGENYRPPLFDEEDDPVQEATYIYVFSYSHPDLFVEITKIENAFKSALGITGRRFIKKGSVEECDKQVYDACKKAFESLKDETWQGNYTFKVINVNTGNLICTANLTADNKNVFK